MAARAHARSRAAASRCQSAGNAPASRDGRASLWDVEDADGCHALSDEAPAEGRHRNGTTRARLQSDPRNEHHRCSTAPGGDEGIVASRAPLSSSMPTRGARWQPLRAPLARKKRLTCPKRREPMVLVQISVPRTFLHNQDPHETCAALDFRTAK